jgi:hypothetical protein
MNNKLNNSKKISNINNSDYSKQKDLPYNLNVLLELAKLNN